MPAVCEEFERQLDPWCRRYAGRPRDEMIRLVLLALEREEIVTVSYRDDLPAARLRSMPVPEEKRELIRHALLWAWRPFRPGDGCRDLPPLIRWGRRFVSPAAAYGGGSGREDRGSEERWSRVGGT